MAAMSEQQNYQQRRNQSPIASRRNGDSSIKEEDEELAALGGKTRLVSRKSPSTPSSPQGVTRNSSSPPRELYSQQQAYATPSPPQGLEAISPVTPDTATSDHQHHHHWNSYGQMPEVYDYGYPQAAATATASQPQQQPHSPLVNTHRPHQQSQAGHWQRDVTAQQSPEIMYVGHNGHHHMQQHSISSAHVSAASSMPVMDIPAMQYVDYSQPQLSPVASYGMQMHSPMDSQIHNVDPDVSWRNLFAQYNQV